MYNYISTQCGTLPHCFFSNFKKNIMNNVGRYELLLRQPKIYIAQAISLRDPRKKDAAYFINNFNKRQLAQWIVEQERIFKKEFITLYKKNNE